MRKRFAGWVASLVFTPIAMDDLDDVRQFLGYSKIDLYGGSYGTRAAIVYARRHPDSTRAVILDAVAPPGMAIPLYMARDSQHSLDLLFDDCEKDPGCDQRFPKLRDRFKALLTRLDAHPQRIRYVDPRTGLEKDLDIRRIVVSSLLFASLYDPTVSSLVPLLIDEADKGNFTGFLALNAASDSIATNMSMGMQFSVLCSEDAPRIDRASIDRDSAGTFLGTAMTELRLKACQIWPHATMDPDYYTNKPSDVPALILAVVWQAEVRTSSQLGEGLLRPAAERVRSRAIVPGMMRMREAPAALGSLIRQRFGAREVAIQGGKDRLLASHKRLVGNNLARLFQRLPGLHQTFGPQQHHESVHVQQDMARFQAETALGIIDRLLKVSALHGNIPEVQQRKD
jgi:pimeloyl-ACP methyl ester carboxylesterase